MRCPGVAFARLPRIAAGAVALSVAPQAQGSCEVQKLLASDVTEDDRFGAGLATDGATLMVGSRDKLEGFVQQGAVYVFTQSGDAWVEDAKLNPSDAEHDDRFGEVLRVLGNEAFISNSADDYPPFGLDQGSVYVFRSNAGNWIELGKLTGSDSTDMDRFGTYLDTDGVHLLVGADGAPFGQQTGAAYFFERSGNQWVEQQKVIASDWALGDLFGNRVAIDGEWAFVSAPRDEDLGESSGSVYVFRFQGGAWLQWQKLLPSDGALGWSFGRGLDAQGDLLVVAATGQPDAAYAFRLQGELWVEERKFVGDDAGVTLLGSEVAVSGDRFAMSATHRAFSGAEWTDLVVVFEHDGSNWQLTGKTAGTDGLPDQSFGAAVTLAGDLLAVGATHKPELGLDEVGAVYIFDAAKPTNCLTVHEQQMSGTSGGGQQMAYLGAPEHASELYLLLGSLSGTSPGVPLGSVLLPLNLDAYGLYTLNHPNEDPLHDSFGSLDAFGSLMEMYFAPSFSIPGLIGQTIHHACIVLQPGGVAVASNPVALAVGP